MRIRINKWLRENYSPLLIFILTIMVGTILLIQVLQASSARREVEEHRQAVEQIQITNQNILKASEKNAHEHRRQNQKSHDEQTRLLCGLVALAPPGRVSDSQRQLCHEAEQRIQAEQNGGDNLPVNGSANSPATRPRVVPSTPRSPNPAPAPQNRPQGNPAPQTSPQPAPQPTPPPPPDNNIIGCVDPPLLGRTCL